MELGGTKTPRSEVFIERQTKIDWILCLESCLGLRTTLSIVSGAFNDARRVTCGSRRSGAENKLPWMKCAHPNVSQLPSQRAFFLSYIHTWYN